MQQAKMFTMPANAQSSPEETQEIELILIGQVHTIPDLSFDVAEEKGIIYSQFKIMQLIQSYPDAAVVQEGIHEDITERGEKLHIEYSQFLFPNYREFPRMDYGALNLDQKKFWRLWMLPLFY